MKNFVLPIAAAAIMIIASCAKKDNTAQVQPDNSTANPATQFIAAQTGFPSLSLMAKIRKYTKGDDDCKKGKGNCHPVDIVITGFQVFELQRAIQGGAAGVKQLFSNNEKATGLIPDWDADWFADVKTAILSGNYTFLRVNESIFLLGKEGKVSQDNFDYAIKYDIR